MDVTQSTIVIIGTGQAGFQVAASLRELRFEGRIVLVGDEPHRPYQRPPLSKSYLLGESAGAELSLRADAFFDQHRIELRAGTRALAIDRAHRRVALHDGSSLGYDQLVLATGARNRSLPVEGIDDAGVFWLRTLDEASALRARMAGAKSAVVIGAGFIGLEFAAAAVHQGLQVSVLDICDRPLARALSSTMSRILAREHAASGVQLHLGTAVKRVLRGPGGVRGVETTDGQILAADLVVVCVGVIPNAELAAACDLRVDDGIAVDELLRTSDPHISAIGDVASHPNAYAHGARARIESVQNATDQARCVAQRLVGRPAAYEAVPWFWSHQGALKLQMAGLLQSGCDEVLRGDPNSASCSVFLFSDDALACVESLNRPADHMLARRLLAARTPLTREQAADLDFDLKTLLPKR